MENSDDNDETARHDGTDSSAQMRTAWAEDRTIMANERTFSSWMGFGLGAVGVAIGLKAVFGDFDPTWAAKLVASLFLAIAIVIYWAARRQACKTLQRLNDNDAEAIPTRSFTILAALLTCHRCDGCRSLGALTAVSCGDMADLRVTRGDAGDR